MTQSSFYADGGIYDTAIVESNDVPASTATTNAPSGFYPAGNLYTALSDADATVTAMTDLKDQTVSAAASASTSASNASNSASAAATSASTAGSAAASAVAAAAGTATPLVNGTAAVGTSAKWAHEDHVHPTDTTRADAAATTSALALKADKTYVDSQDALKAPLASPTFTGTPAAPTATAGTNTTQLATTAFVTTAVGASVTALNTKTGALTFSVVNRKFTSSGTYTPTAGMVFAVIECVGSGGGGGSASGNVGSNFAGGGGGSGSYSRAVVSAATVGASKAVTIGAAGAGGAAGTNNGGAGGDVSVGTLCIAKGGSGGFYGNNAQVGGGGAGGVAGTGDVTGAGAAGGPGNYHNGGLQPAIPAGFGGSSLLGGGAPAPGFSSGTLAPGNNATGFGSGGSGGMAPNIATSTKGGDGSAGIVIITEYVIA